MTANRSKTVCNIEIAALRGVTIATRHQIADEPEELLVTLGRTADHSSQATRRPICPIARCALKAAPSCHYTSMLV